MLFTLVEMCLFDHIFTIKPNSEVQHYKKGAEQCVVT